jgi:hypothetical protein
LIVSKLSAFDRLVSLHWQGDGEVVDSLWHMQGSIGVTGDKATTAVNTAVGRGSLDCVFNTECRSEPYF